MQFRERRRVIQVIRTVYDPAIKRGRSEMLGKLDKDNPEIDPSLRAACSAEELAEVEGFIAGRADALTQEAMRDAAVGLARQMRVAEQYFRSAAATQSGELASEIYVAWDDLKKAMHKAGCRKAKKR